MIFEKNSAYIKRLLNQTVLAVASLATGASLRAAPLEEQKPASPPETIAIAYAAHPQTALAQVAHSRGYFRGAGLEATAHKFPSGKAALEYLLEGKADFATVAETPVMLAIMKGEKISVIATIQTSSLAHALLARKDRGILSLGDIKGKRIGVAVGSSSHFFLDGILIAHGISSKDVEVVDLKAEKIPDALAQGDIDAGSTFTPYVEHAQQKLGSSVITFREKTIYRYNFLVVATQEFIRKNPDKVRKMLSALVKAEGFVRENPAEAQIIVADFCGIELAIVRDSWADATLAVTLDQPLILALEGESRWAIKGGLTGARQVPNYLDFIYLGGLKSVKPEAMRILR